MLYSYNKSISLINLHFRKQKLKKLKLSILLSPKVFSDINFRKTRIFTTHK